MAQSCDTNLILPFAYNSILNTSNICHTEYEHYITPDYKRLSLEKVYHHAHI